MRIQEVMKNMGSVLTIDSGKLNQISFYTKKTVETSNTESHIESDVSVHFTQNVSVASDNVALYSLHLELSSNPLTSSQLLSTLARESYASIRSRVAANPNVAANTLVELAQDDTFEVLLRVANNPNSPEKVLAQLSRHENSEIRIRVARNSNASHQILSELLMDPDFRVRSYVSTNINKQSQLTRCIVSIKRPDEDCISNKINHYAVENNLLSFVADKDPIVRANVAKHVSTSAKMLAQLSEDRSSLVRINVAGHRNTDVKVLQSLSCDDDHAVRSTIAANPHTSSDILSNLILDKSRAVRMGVLMNPNTSDEIKNLLKLMEVQQQEKKTPLAIEYSPRLTLSAVPSNETKLTHITDFLAGSIEKVSEHLKKGKSFLINERFNSQRVCFNQIRKNLSQFAQTVTRNKP